MFPLIYQVAISLTQKNVQNINSDLKFYVIKKSCIKNILVFPFCSSLACKIFLSKLSNLFHLGLFWKGNAIFDDETQIISST